MNVVNNGNDKMNKWIHKRAEIDDRQNILTKVP